MRRSLKFFSKRKPLFWIIILILVILIGLVKCRSNDVSNKKQGMNQAVPVVTAIAQSRDVPVYFSALGSVIPTYTVTVKTQINGRLLKVFFKEGQNVKAGDLLAQIDPQFYQAQVTQFEGQLARDKALLVNAQIDLKRYQTLWRQDSVAKQTLDTQTALVKQYEGTVKLDQGLLDSARVNFAYCRIVSPIDGWVGLRLVDEGNLVQTSDVNGLVVINTVNPITVVFSIPEDQIPKVQKQIKAGKTLTVQAYDRSQKQLLATGSLLTIDNQIDPTTGTIKLKAQFQNDDHRLFPNQFVNVLLLADTLYNTIVVPTAAIQHGAQGTFVYRLNTNNTVSVKAVVVGVTQGDMTTISSGVLVRQIVVVEGADKLTNGSAVKTSAK
jgi:multidrug efflux system membrane fusion protein